MTMPGGAEIASADAPVISGARQWPAATRQEYAAERTGPIYFLLHIPKTAGQTIQMHLAEHCAPGVFWQSQRRLRPGRRASAQDFPDIDRARVISGHHIGRSLERYFPGREVRRIVLLRDPLQMQLSFYNWKMMDHLAKGWGTYSFSLHLRALPRNFMTHFLLSRWVELSQPKLMAMSDTRKYQILNRALAGFWFVGAHSDCDRVIAAIGADLGVPPMAAPRNTSAEAQAHTGWRLVTAQSLSPSMRAAIRAKNPLDYALWESWGAAGFDPAKVRPAALSRATEHDGFGPRGDSPLVPVAPLCPPRMGRAPAAQYRAGRSRQQRSRCGRLGTRRSPLSRCAAGDSEGIRDLGAVRACAERVGTCRRGGTGLSAILAAQSRQRRYPFAARPRTQAATAISARRRTPISRRRGSIRHSGTRATN